MRKKRLLSGLLCMLWLILVLFNGGYLHAEEACMQSFYQKSLHFTGEGMRYWYEAENGFMAITKIPYDNLGCKSCHVKSCDQCHAYTNEKGVMEFSIVRSRGVDKCFTCHERGKLVAEYTKKSTERDVHTAAGMTCIDCHREDDIHGDGIKRMSMRDRGAVNASCEGCHVGENASAPKFDIEITAHKKHGKGTKIHCNACHVRWSMTCYNCHFSEYMKTKSKKGNFIPTNAWFMLLNYQNKVTAGTAMVLVNNKQAFVSYTPYFTHNIMKEGRPCQECHGNEAMELVKADKKIPLVTVEKEKIKFWEGVIPVAEGLLQWKFLDKKDGNWVSLDLEKPTIERYSLYAEPLKSKQLNLMRLRFNSKKRKKREKRGE